MPTYKLYYFPARGRAESTRWLFAVGGVPYEDVRLAGEEWQKFKPKTPFGQMPALEVDGKLIAQSNSINRLVAKRIGLAGSNDMEEARINMVVDCIEDSLKPLSGIFFAKDDTEKEALKKKYREDQCPTFFAHFERLLKDNKSGFFVGTKMSWADVVFVSAFDMYKFAGVDNMDKFPLVKALGGKVTSQPKIAEWIKKRPVTER